MDLATLPSIDELAALSATEFDAAMAQADRIRRQVETFLAEGSFVAEDQGRYQRDGHRTVTAWGQATFNWSGPEALRIARNGRALAALPVLRDACRAGLVGVAQLSEFGRVHANPRCAEQLSESDLLLTTLARERFYREFKQAIDRWESLADADGAERDHRDAHEGRKARIVNVGAQGVLTGQSGASDGLLLREILDRFADAEFHRDADEARARLGRPVTAADLARTRLQRMFDALKVIFLTAAAAAPGVVGTEPLVNIVLDQRTAEELLRRAAGEDVASPPASEFTDRRCESADGLLLSHQAALAALVVGRFRRMVIDSARVITDLGRKQRLFRGSARDAVMLGDLRCLWPGCDLRTGHCDADHTTPWTDDGHTKSSNGGAACPHHNHFKQHGYTTRRDPAGVWHVYRPDGTEIGEHARFGAA